MRKTKVEKGITLVALIITIIVLLILAVVAINAVQNDGIIEYAKNSRTEYEKAQGEEQNTLNYYLSQIEVTQGAHNGIIPKDGKYYVGVPQGTADIQSITPTYIGGEKFPEKPQTGDIYLYGDYEYRYNLYGKVDTNGNFEEWKLVPSKNAGFNGWGVKLNSSRNEDHYEEILTTINNYNVKLLFSTFMNCKSLKKAPVIPNTIKIMQNTFWGCEKLETAPEIPDSVTNMSGTFAGCKILQIPPQIPDSVTTLYSTFQDCYELQTAPKIPDNVTTMQNTFNYCKKITTAPEIPANVTNLYHTFWGCENLTGDVIIKTTQEKIDLSKVANYEGCFHIINDSGSVTNKIELIGIIEGNEYKNKELLEALVGTATQNVKADVTIKPISNNG